MKTPHRRGGSPGPRVRILRMLIVLLSAAFMLLGLVGVSTQTASAESPAADSAVNWAAAQEGSTAWDGLCLQFVHDAYAQAGVDLYAEASNSDSAIDFWNSYTGTKYPAGSTSDTENPPVGALVFWGPTSTNPYGHVAVSSGNTAAISSEERTYVGVHEFSIPDRDANFEAQLGYIIPG